MTYLSCIGLDSPRLLDVLRTTMSTAAEVTIATTGGASRAHGQLQHREPGQWSLVLSEPYLGPSPVSVHVWIPACSMALEASIIDRLGSNCLQLGPIHWLVRVEREFEMNSFQTVPVRYAEAGESTWHSGTIWLLRDRYIQLSGPVALLPGTACALRLVTDAPLPVFLRGSCRSVRAEGNAYLMDVSCHGLSAQAERHMMRALGLSKHEVNE